MIRAWGRVVVAAGILALMLAFGCGKTETPAAAPGAGLTFGVIMPGPINDHGWCAAHHEAGAYVEKKMPGARLLYVDNVNASAKPGVTIPQVVESLAAQGAKLIITASEDFRDGTDEAARAHPELYFINVGGDHAWREGRAFTAPPNVSNLFATMEYGKAIAGFAAGLTTQTGKIGYVGPLVNEESRRLAAATYLGARHAWVHERHQDPAKFVFNVTWIGFWFNIPGQTLDPTRVADEFFNAGHDVVISGINTTEVLVEAGKLARAGKPVWAVPYDFREAFSVAPEAALGVPYFNWGPAYLRAATMVQENRWQQSFWWDAPEWAAINDPDRGAVGFLTGSALAPENKIKIEAYIKGLGDGSIPLFAGPLNYQDGSVFLKAGETATAQQIWYLPQLLQGMTGATAR